MHGRGLPGRRRSEAPPDRRGKPIKKKDPPAGEPERRSPVGDPPPKKGPVELPPEPDQRPRREPRRGRAPRRAGYSRPR